PTPGEADHRVQIPREKNALLAGCPLQDDGVRPVVKTDVYDSDNVQGRLATPQAPNNRIVNVFIAYQAKHVLSAPSGLTVWRAIPRGWVAWPRSPAATFPPLLGGLGCNRQSLFDAAGNKRSPRTRPLGAASDIPEQ